MESNPNSRLLDSNFIHSRNTPFPLLFTSQMLSINNTQSSLNYNTSNDSNQQYIFDDDEETELNRRESLFKWRNKTKTYRSYMTNEGYNSLVVFSYMQNEYLYDNEIPDNYQEKKVFR